MDVSNTVWTPVAPSSTDFIVQNVGGTTIGFVMAASLPGPTDNTDEGEHGILSILAAPWQVPSAVLDTNTLYVRSFGPKAGKLFVS